MKHTIKKEIWIRIAFIFLVVIASGIITTFSMNSIKKYTESTKQATKINSLVLKAEKAHCVWVENLSSAITMGTEFTGSMDYETCALGQWLYNTDPSEIGSDRILSLMEEIKPLHQAVHESAKTVLDLNKKSPEQAKQLYLNTTKANVSELISILDEISSITDEQVLSNEDALINSVTVTELISIASIIIILIVCILLVIYVIKSIVHPIQEITLNSRKLSEGILDFEIDVKSKNEIGLLAESLNKSVHNLKTYISDISMILDELSNGNLKKESEIHYVGDFIQIEKAISTITNGLNNTMKRIQESARQVDSGSLQVATGSQHLAQGATEQAAEVSNLLCMIDEITEQINNSSQSADITTEEAGKVGENISVCSAHMNEMIEAMGEINSCSNEVHNIIKTIEDIAFQTNILALNAAVEAARAGSAGKGFAVVADEVRNLAAKSADAAKSTTELIEKTLAVVNNGSRLTDLTRDSLLSVVDGAETVTEHIRAISQASKEQENAITNIKESISQISTVVHSNTATSEESAAASEELASQAQILKSLTGQFKLKN